MDEFLVGAAVAIAVVGFALAARGDWIAGGPLLLLAAVLLGLAAIAHESGSRRRRP